jgi:hypothetical protein
MPACRVQQAREQSLLLQAAGAHQQGHGLVRLNSIATPSCASN